MRIVENKHSTENARHESQTVLSGFTVLVINASQNMAKEISFQLSLDIPGCSIMYAPTIDLARWMLARREIDLVVSSDILPDGSISKLKGVLQKMSDPPDMVVVGGLGMHGTEMLEESGYHFSRYRCLEQPAAMSVGQNDDMHQASQRPGIEHTISSLGADIRHHLNNPLQAIVAMAFVAQSGRADPAVLEQALDSIEKVAHNMSQIVNSLEAKIRDAVTPLAANR